MRARREGPLARLLARLLVLPLRSWGSGRMRHAHRHERAVLVVLGAALTAEGELGPALAERVRAAVDAYRAGVAPNLIMTGAQEAEPMRVAALRSGVPEEAVWLERTARSTRENALRSAEVMRVYGCTDAIIVTQPYHRRRAVAAFARVGVCARALEFESELVPLRQVVREFGALTVYWVRGWVSLACA